MSFLDDLDENERQFAMIMGKELLILAFKVIQTARAKGVDLEKLMEEARIKNWETIDD